MLELDSRNAIHFAHESPARDAAPCFVFVNALTGSAASWEAEIAPALRERGFGTLTWNFRGQELSRFDPGVALTPALIVDDLVAVLDHVSPQRAILVGLSIGGLFAAQAILSGAAAQGLVLLNTLRKINPRIAWVNDALPALAAEGGARLFLDAMFPLLVGPRTAAAKRPDFLSGGYEKPRPEDGHLNLMRNAPDADWDIAWDLLALPVLSITGLQDRVFLDLAVVDRLYAWLPDARREDWEEEGHLLPMENPARLVESLARFGSEIETRR